MVKKYRKLKHQRVKQQNWKRSKNLSTGSHIQGCEPPAGLHKGGRVAQAERSPNGINRSLWQSPGPFWLLWPNAIGRAAYKQQGLISHSLEAGESKMKAPWDWASDEGRFLLNRWHVLCPGKGRGIRELSEVSFIRAWVLFIMICSLPESPTSKYYHLGDSIFTREFCGDTDFQSMAWGSHKCRAAG